jgi:hypothetical protein
MPLRIDRSGPVDLPDPELPEGKVGDEETGSFVGAKYVRMKGELFVADIEASDIEQNELGTCFFLASLAAVAHTDPERVKNMVKENGDGTYTVTFQKRTHSGTVVPVEVTVDADLPTTAEGKPLGVSPKREYSSKVELWPAIIEKAFAELQGGYHVVNEGGNPYDALPYLTGKNVSHRLLKSVKSDDKLWSLLQDGLARKAPMLTGTPGEDHGDVEDSGIVPGHAYTLLDAYERDGVRFVKIRNPWGWGEPGADEDDDRKAADGRNDGVFELSFEEWRRLFEDLDISKN